MRRPSPAAGRPPHPPPKQKAVRPWQGKTAFKNYWQANFTPLRRAQQQGQIEVAAVLAAYLALLGAMIGRQIWLLGYRLEDVRQQSAGRGHLWRQAAACIALAILRLVGVRHA